MLPVTFTDTYGKHEPLFSWIECWTENLNAHESDYWNVGRCIYRWEHSSVAVFSVLVKIIIGQTEISVFISRSWQESKWVFFFQPQIVLLIIMDHDKPLKSPLMSEWTCINSFFFHLQWNSWSWRCIFVPLLLQYSFPFYTVITLSFSCPSPQNYRQEAVSKADVLK